MSLLMTCPEMIKRLIGRPRRFGLTNKIVSVLRHIFTNNFDNLRILVNLNHLHFFLKVDDKPRLLVHKRIR